MTVNASAIAVVFGMIAVAEISGGGSYKWISGLCFLLCGALLGICAAMTASDHAKPPRWIVTGVQIAGITGAVVKLFAVLK